MGLGALGRRLHVSAGDLPVPRLVHRKPLFHLPHHQEWGFDWWQKTFNSFEIHQLFKTSISIALLVTVIAVVIVLWRPRLRAL